MKKRNKMPGPVLVARNEPGADAAQDCGGGRETRRPLASSATGPPFPEPGLAARMSGNAPRMKTRGRLNRAVLAMLGKGLEECFEEVRKQEVPERFKLLLQRF
jgi:hypothetical protein